MSPKRDRLLVRFGSDCIGQVYRQGSRTIFEYEDGWRERPDSFPLSYSLPLESPAHRGEAVSSYLWGLLPDNDNLLRRWAGRFGVSRTNALGLLANMGEDCAGAATFSTEDDARGHPTGASVDWLDDAQLCERISDLAGAALGGRLRSDEGQFSLAGAQSKAALRYDARRNRWGVPRGQEPTTSILKPAMADYEAQAWNEHFCLSLARAVGLAAAQTSVIDVCGHSVLVVERFDRIQDESGAWVRIHQEDMCQALGKHPSLKYERDGGPGIADMIRVLDASADAPTDRLELLRAMLFNLLLVGTDAHAKNFGILWDAGSYMRLAPLYDMNSALPYTRPTGNQFDRQRLKLPMRIGGKYELESIQVRHIRRMAEECKISPSKIVREFEVMIAAMPDAVREVTETLDDQGAPVEFLDRLSSGILGQCSLWQSRLASPHSPA